MDFAFNGRCCAHSFETATDLCRRCGSEFCDECVVHPGGKPMCKECAMVAGGVRRTNSRPEVTKRELRRRLKEFKTVLAMRKAPEPDAAVVTDPVLDGHDPIGPPSGDGMERLGLGTESHPVRVENDDDMVDIAARLASLSSPTLPAETGQAGEIDWSRPFG